MSDAEPTAPDGDSIYIHVPDATRADVLRALVALPDPTWVLALSAAKGVIAFCGDSVMPDPTAEYTAVKAIEDHITAMSASK